MSTHNIGFYEDLTKIIFELSSNTHRISSADNRLGHLSEWAYYDFRECSKDFLYVVLILHRRK